MTNKIVIELIVDFIDKITEKGITRLEGEAIEGRVSVYWVGDNLRIDIMPNEKSSLRKQE